MTDEEQGLAFESGLTTSTFGRPLRYYAIALTTEALALGWARQESAPEGATIVAGQELSPRQRKGPPWVPFAGKGLYASVVLRPALPPEGEGLLWLLAALGAAEGLAALGGLDVGIKWPDDLVVGERKIGAVKVEAQLGPGEIVSAVITLRVNVNVTSADLPEEMRDTATSLQIESGAETARSDVLNAMLTCLERRYDDDVPRLLDAYRGRCKTIGRGVKAHLLPRGEVMGTASDVDNFGSLLVDVGTKTATVPIDVLKKLEVSR